MKTLLVATSNKHKLQEINHILKSFEVKGVDIKVNENGKTFEENALKKARALWKKEKELTIADDSGLCVKAMGDKPGVKSARFATPPTPENLCNKLLKKLSGERKRLAFFVCAVAIIFPNGQEKVVKGICKGKIALEICGNNGFGYDQVFIPNGYKKTFGELSSKTKNRISHRGIALQIMKKAIKLHKL